MLALALAAVAISFAAILFRLAPGLHPLAAAGWRLTVAGLLLAPFFSHLPRAARREILPAGAAYALHFGAWVASLGLVSVLVSTTLVTTTPLMLAAVALMTGRDRPRARTLVGLGVGALGVVLLGAASDAGAAASWPHAREGVALAIVGAAAMAFYFLRARRVALPTWRASLAYAGTAALVGGVLLLLAALVAGVGLLPASASEAAVIIGAAALPQLVGHTLLTWALARTTPTTVALATLGEPIGAALLAALLLDEPLTVLGIAASLTTLSAVAFALTGARATEPAPPPRAGPLA